MSGYAEIVTKLRIGPDRHILDRETLIKQLSRYLTGKKLPEIQAECGYDFDPPTMLVALLYANFVGDATIVRITGQKAEQLARLSPEEMAEAVAAGLQQSHEARSEAHNELGRVNMAAKVCAAIEVNLISRQRAEALVTNSAKLFLFNKPVDEYGKFAAIMADRHAAAQTLAAQA